MLLLAKLDGNLDFAALDKSKKMKTTFKKQAQRSTFELTREFSDLLEDVELLDDNYRTPETHKMGRVLGLTYNGYFGTQVNEVLSFQNTALKAFNRICEHIRKER
ncbi:MAG: hypothetical protein JRJ75_16370 [Deltaproteobacteria bacterium]|nr:hypothetical protein [Deltaproteobacteria bacterium]